MRVASTRGRKAVVPLRCGKTRSPMFKMIFGMCNDSLRPGTRAGLLWVTFGAGGGGERCKRCTCRRKREEVKDTGRICERMM